MITIEAKIGSSFGEEILRDLGTLFGKVSRNYFVDRHIREIPVNDLKKWYQGRYEISSRHFNSIRSDMDGKVRAYEELLELNCDNRREQIKATQRSIAKIDRDIKSSRSDIKKILNYKKRLEDWKLKGKGKRPKLPPALKAKQINALDDEIADKTFRRHQKMRRFGILKDKLSKLEQVKAPSLCFGSKELFRKQFHLEESGYSSHEEWKKEWTYRRSSQSFFIGAHCETARNLNAQYDPFKKTLTVRLPACLEQKYGSTHITIENLEFHYGQEWLKDAILNPISEENGKKRYTPVSYRFIERRMGDSESEFFCQALFEQRIPEKTTDPRIGAIGLDLNADHIAMMETDRFGNPIFAQSYPFSMKESSDQIEAVFGDHIAIIVERAKQTGKIIVCEKLDFKRKKQALRESSPKSLREVLSSFAYKKFFDLLNARCDREGVRLKRVNPAFTSIIGFYKYLGYEIYTSHECAALTIARRGLGLSERAKTKVTPNPTVSMEEPLVEVPEFSHSNSDGHVWSFYSRHAKSIREILFQRSPKGRKRLMFYNPRHPSSYRAGLRCDWTLLRCLSP